MTSAPALTYPLISELKQILLDTYYGRDFTEGEVAAKKDVAAAPKAEKKAKKIRLIPLSVLA